MSPWRTEMFRRLNAPLSHTLGAKTASAFEQLRVHTVGDLLRHLPRRYLAGTELTDLSSLEEGELVAVMAKVLRADVKTAKYGAKGRPSSRLEAVLSDGHGTLVATFFGKQHLCDWWSKQLARGVRGIFVGKVGRFRDTLQMTHPRFIMLDAAGAVVGASEEDERIAELSRSGLVGMYPATAKLPTWTIAECARIALETVQGVEDPWPDWVRREGHVCGLLDAFGYVHRPSRPGEVDEGNDRLLFDEAFCAQLTMAYRRAENAKQSAGPRPRRPGGILDAFDARLPFVLTAGQVEVSEAIFADLARDRPMQRLLQGEVGSGKTLVALRAMLAVVDAGGQAVLLAPTEVLAHQHFRTITALLGDLGAGRTLGAADDATDVVVVTGSMTAIAKRNALLKAASGEAGIVIGTHALLADHVQFPDLGLVVVDEQHRFGVEQRAVLTDRASARPHVLVLTATPIPRSVAMTVFGDLEISTLVEQPGGRANVSTTVVDGLRNPAWIDRAWQRIREEVAQGRQAFIVAPRIGKATPTDPGGVAHLYDELRTGALEGVRVGMLHGQLPTDEKDRVMGEFARGELDVLVATTVIEVGVDVPNAAMMVIWDADRFGISQLHQLRGRIGRGEHPGVCLLVSHADAAAPSWERLRAVAATRDGFALADLDLAQRREGDVLGADQAGGRSSLRLLRVLEHGEVIARARAVAERAVAVDPDRQVPAFMDAVTYTEQLSDGDWLDRS